MSTPATAPASTTTDAAKPEEAPKRPRLPKPSERLDADASRILGALLAGGVGIETVAALARSSESTIRRFHDGQTGSRASVSGVALAVVVAACTHAPELASKELPALVRLAREHTPGGVGLNLPLLVGAAPATRSYGRRRPDAAAARVPEVARGA